MVLSVMQHADEVRRLELLRLANRSSQIPFHLGLELELAQAQAGLPVRALLETQLGASLRSPLTVSPSLLYPGLTTSSMAARTLLRAPAPLPLSVTRGLVQTSGHSTSLPYGNTISNVEKPTSVSTPPVPTLGDSYQRYQGERSLPNDFKPGPNSVIIGRKKNCYTSVGNLKLRDIVLMSLPAYSKCSKKKDKTEVVSSIVQMVRESCPDGGAFVKCDDKGKWHEVSEVIARERVASIFRDFLHDQYRSSSKSKVAKRREKRAKELIKKTPSGVDETKPEADDSSEDASTSR